MLHYLLYGLVLALCLLAAAFRYAVVQSLGSIETREPDTLTRVRLVLRICLANPNKAKLVLTKDRSNAGASRRRKPNIAKLRHKKYQEKKIDELRVKLAKRLRQKSL